MATDRIGRRMRSAGFRQAPPGPPGILGAPRPDARDHDVAVVRLTARGRVLLATAAAMVASVIPSTGDGPRAVLSVLGMFWVPWSGFVAIEADRRAPRFTRLAGAVGDLLVLFFLAAAVSMSGPAVLLGCVVVVLLGTYTGGVREGALLSLLALVIVLIAGQWGPSAGGLGPSTVVLFAMVLGLLLLVVERATGQQREATLQSERLAGRSQAILERVADGVVVTDWRGTILEANPAALGIMECSDSELGGRHCREALQLGIGERRLDCSAGCALLAQTQAPDAEHGQEVWRVSGDGRRRPLLANVSAIADSDGNVQELVHSLRDITSLKQADEAKTLFLATASHELKTPLTVIRGYGEVLLQSTDMTEDERAEAAAAIVRRSVELTGIVDRLLLSSRIESGRLKLDVHSVAMGPIVEERGASLRLATGRDVQVDVPADLPAAEADAAAVTTVLDHLLENAIKYSPEGGAVRVRADADDGHVRVRVSDEGIGMDSEQAARCFEKFWQAESTDDRRFKGTGIGLYIVRSLVEAMGGTIGVETSRGRGSVFTVILRRPILAGPDQVADAREASIVREFMRQIGIPEGTTR